MVRRRAVPYFLLGPGTIWLVLFFVVPLYYLGKLSLESGFVGSLEFSWNWSNYSEALSAYDTQFIRSFELRRRQRPCSHSCSPTRWPT